MKNWGVPEIIAGKLLHSGQNSRGICKSIKIDIFWLENNLYLHYSHKEVIVRVEKQHPNYKIGTLAKISGEHSPVIYPNAQFFTHDIIMGTP